MNKSCRKIFIAAAIGGGRNPQKYLAFDPHIVSAAAMFSNSE